MSVYAATKEAIRGLSRSVAREWGTAIEAQFDRLDIVVNLVGGVQRRNYGGDPEGHAGTSKEAEAVVDEIRSANGTAIADTTTVGDSTGADRIIARAFGAFGRIDSLINNAGGSTIAAIDALADEVIERVMRTNYWGPYLLLRRAWPHMRRQGYGRILNVSSPATLGIGTVAPYSSAKAALIGLTCKASIEGKPHGICVNAIFPAEYTRLAAKSQDDARVWIETHFVPHLVAQAVAYFVSREVKYTGEVFSVGGGRVSCIATFNNDGFFNRKLTPELAAEHSKRFAT